MNDTLIANICATLSTMKADQRWTTSHEDAFFLGLHDLPDEAGVVLRREILLQWDWRPSVKEVRDLWERVSAPKAARQADQVVAEILALRDRYGEYVVPDPAFPRILHAGEPEWTDPVKRRVIAAMGGWVTFCRDEGLGAAQRAHLAKFAEAALGDAGDAAIERLRLEYREARATALEATPDAHRDASAPALPSPRDDGGLARVDVREMAGGRR